MHARACAKESTLTVTSLRLSNNVCVITSGRRRHHTLACMLEHVEKTEQKAYLSVEHADCDKPEKQAQAIT